MTVYASPDTHHSISAPPLYYSSRNRVVGLHGVARAGKDTLAEGLTRYGYRRVALADPLRRSMYATNPIVQVDSVGRVYRLQEIVNELGWDEAKAAAVDPATGIPEIRRILQKFGTEGGRDVFGENVWTDLALRQITTPGHWVVTDVRFPNEVEMIRHVEGMLIKIVRPGYGPINAHASDAGLADGLFDQVIVNDGTIEDLYEKAYRAILREGKP